MSAASSLSPTARRRKPQSHTRPTEDTRPSALARRSPPPATPAGHGDFELETINGAARRLKVSVSWMKRSTIPFKRLGRLRRYDLRDLERYVAARNGAMGGY